MIVLFESSKPVRPGSLSNEQIITRLCYTDSSSEWSAQQDYRFVVTHEYSADKSSTVAPLFGAYRFTTLDDARRHLIALGVYDTPDDDEIARLILVNT